MEFEVGVWEVFYYIGVLYICKKAVVFLWQVFQGLRAHVFSKCCPTNFVKKYGQWAVVTGCTSGIGRAYAFELAQRGLNIVLISRSEEKLQATANELAKRHHIETKIIQADFKEGRSLYQRLSDELRSVDVGILVNNVGMAGDELLYVTELKESFIWDIINVNVAAVVMMTRIVLPGMLRNRRGVIINVSSMAGSRPIPLMAVYSATKSFTSSLSNVLNEECRGSGVTVQNVFPGFVNTEMLNVMKPMKNKYTLITPSAEQWAGHAVATIGIVKDTAGYWAHGIMAWGRAEFVPRWLWYAISSWTSNRFRRIQQPQAPTKITDTIEDQSNHNYLPFLGYKLS